MLIISLIVKNAFIYFIIGLARRGALRCLSVIKINASDPSLKQNGFDYHFLLIKIKICL